MADMGGRMPTEATEVNVYARDKVPGSGTPYTDPTGRQVYWTAVSGSSAAEIKANDMKSTDLASGKTTDVLALKEFGEGTYAKWDWKTSPYYQAEASVPKINDGSAAGPSTGNGSKGLSPSAP